jgi:hypothetical protein
VPFITKCDLFKNNPGLTIPAYRVDLQYPWQTDGHQREELRGTVAAVGGVRLSGSIAEAVDPSAVKGDFAGQSLTDRQGRR